MYREQLLHPKRMNPASPTRKCSCYNALVTERERKIGRKDKEREEECAIETERERERWRDRN